MSYEPPPPYGHPQQPPVVSGPPTQPFTAPPNQYAPPGFGQPAPLAQPPAKKSSPLKVLLITVASVLGGCLLLGGITAALGGGDDSTTVAPPKPADGAAEPAGEAKPKGAPVEESAEEDETFDVPVGSAITASRGGDTIEATLRSVKSHKSGCNSLGVDPDNGLFVVVDIVVTQRKGEGSVNPLDFTFVAADGTSAHGLSAAFSGCDEPSLDSADLRAGQKRAGKIAFDVNSKAGTLEWAPGGLGADTVGSWKTS